MVYLSYFYDETTSSVTPFSEQKMINDEEHQNKHIYTKYCIYFKIMCLLNIKRSE